MFSIAFINLITKQLMMFYNLNMFQMESLVNKQTFVFQTAALLVRLLNESGFFTVRCDDAKSTRYVVQHSVNSTFWGWDWFVSEADAGSCFIEDSVTIT